MILRNVLTLSCNNSLQLSKALGIRGNPMAALKALDHEAAALSCASQHRIRVSVGCQEARSDAGDTPRYESRWHVLSGHIKAQASSCSAYKLASYAKSH